MCNYACANVMLQLSESFLLMQILHEDTLVYIYIYIYIYIYMSKPINSVQ